ncbi:hypothetical protein QAD02_020027 [Eretmocerus hayati]|uniref:Uncharacterized protein n=1 Tax=Eretmocerus hayati TaxID=131215 RepID=A0ACC2PKV7_9HYME|nr:hypothetical protein QAD02_020027 [Eretmocerus hayati]
MEQKKFVLVFWTKTRNKSVILETDLCPNANEGEVTFAKYGSRRRQKYEVKIVQKSLSSDGDLLPLKRKLPNKNTLDDKVTLKHKADDKNRKRAIVSTKTSAQLANSPSIFVEPGSDGAEEPELTNNSAEVYNRDQACSSGLQKNMKKTNQRILYSDLDEEGSDFRNGREGDYQLASEERFEAERPTRDFENGEVNESEYERDGRRLVRERPEELEKQAESRNASEEEQRQAEESRREAEERLAELEKQAEQRRREAEERRAELERQAEERRREAEERARREEVERLAEVRRREAEEKRAELERQAEERRREAEERARREEEERLAEERRREAEERRAELERQAEGRRREAEERARREEVERLAEERRREAERQAELARQGDLEREEERLRQAEVRRQRAEVRRAELERQLELEDQGVDLQVENEGEGRGAMERRQPDERPRNEAGGDNARVVALDNPPNLQQEQQARQRGNRRGQRRPQRDDQPMIGPVLLSGQAGDGRVLLCNVYNVWIDRGRLTWMQRFFEDPRELTRRLLKELVGEENLREMCARGNSPNTRPVPEEIMNAVEYYVNRTCVRMLTPVQFTNVVNMMCASLRNPRR